jgi:hypothetical protein
VFGTLIEQLFFNHRAFVGRQHELNRWMTFLKGPKDFWENPDRQTVTPADGEALNGFGILISHESALDIFEVLEHGLDRVQKRSPCFSQFYAVAVPHQEPGFVSFFQKLELLRY